MNNTLSPCETCAHITYADKSTGVGRCGKKLEIVNTMSIQACHEFEIKTLDFQIPKRHQKTQLELF